MTLNLAACEGNNCPQKNDCKRFQTQQKSLKEGKYYPYYVGSSYKDGKCDLFLDMNRDTEVAPIITNEEYYYYY